jgi:hypothetical protein
MSCKLVTVQDPPPDFTGPIGETVQLAVSGTQGEVSVLSASYGGQDITNSLQFVIAAGLKELFIDIANTVVGDETRVEELCDVAVGTRNTLKSFPWNPIGGIVRLEIEGV